MMEINTIAATTVILTLVASLEIIVISFGQRLNSQQSQAAVADSGPMDKRRSREP